MKYRCIQEEQIVSDKRDSYREKNKRIDDAWDALTWSLSHSPQIGLELEIKGRFLYKQEGTNVTPTIRVLYTYDDSLVAIKAIDIIDNES